MEQFQQSVYWYGTEKHFLELKKKHPKTFLQLPQPGNWFFQYLTTELALVSSDLMHSIQLVCTLNLLFFHLPFRADDRQAGGTSRNPVRISGSTVNALNANSTTNSTLNLHLNVFV